jgi:tRNA dimethylallyltransferase
MIDNGLIEEAQRLYPLRHLNSLNTVGYKELFDYFDGKYDLNTAIEKIKQHSRNYARKQLSWFKRDKEIHWINLSDEKIDVEAQIMKQLSHL